VKVRLSTTRQADDQAIAAHDWWRTHRFAAPDLFRRELAAAFDLLANAPDVGKRYKHRGVPGLRRLLLPNTRYHVYYIHDSERAVGGSLAEWMG